VTVKFDAENGAQHWWRRSPVPVKNEGHRIRIVADGRGGVYTAGTQLKQGNTPAMFLLHYDNQGKPLRQYTSPINSRFSDLLAMDQDGVVLCGDMLSRAANKTANRDALLVRVNYTGSELWRVPVSLSESNGGDDIASRLAQGSGGMFYVGGVGTIPLSGSQPIQQAFWIAQVAAGGNIRWLITFAQTDWELNLNSLAASENAVYAGGRIKAADHTAQMAALAFDIQGNRKWAFAVTRSQDIRSTEAESVALADDAAVFGGTISHLVVNATSVEKADTLIQTIKWDGTAGQQFVFNGKDNGIEKLKRLISVREPHSSRRCLYAVGQSKAPFEQAFSLVLKYQP
jgi:outer membrane protein assembly factor BamB